MRWAHFHGLLALVLLGSICSHVWAQRPPARTSPRQFGGPPVYDLLRQRTGILPNYYQFYRPRQQLQQTLTTQDYQLQHQDTLIRTMQNQWQSSQQADSTLTPTGSRSHFMDYMHFYPGLSRSGTR